MFHGLIHSLKSPIFALSGEVEQIEEYIEEYATSIGDKMVTVKDHQEIAKDMFEWLDKMKVQVENISDSINAVRSQVITLNEDPEKDTFTVEELVKCVDILTKNILKQYLTILNFTVRVNNQKEIKGSLNLLVQVINNLIINSIESYKGKTNQVINILINEVNGKLEISVIDTGCGIPKNIQSKVFKEIITTNPNKVGLGLFVAYSNIKAGFDGDITFKTKEGKGTTIKIIIPIS